MSVSVVDAVDGGRKRQACQFEVNLERMSVSGSILKGPLIVGEALTLTVMFWHPHVAPPGLVPGAIVLSRGELDLRNQIRPRD